ncbi:MAG: hypothetical protein AAF497_28955 [Planctomycetota bacterium]
MNLEAGIALLREVQQAAGYRPVAFGTFVPPDQISDRWGISVRSEDGRRAVVWNRAEWLEFKAGAPREAISGATSPEQPTRF